MKAALPFTFASILLAVVAAACGSKVETNGSGGNALCPQEAVPCCSTPSDPCCAVCNNGGAGGSGTGGSIGTGGTGGLGATCGGIAGLQCAADEYCDFPDDQCGGNDGSGVCTKRPAACPDIADPTCGCDGQIYGNGCDAQAAGADASNLGGCMAPAGQFSCGAHFCPTDLSYCEETLSDVGGTPSSYQCKSLPAGCGSSHDCACLLTSVPCGSTCVLTSENASMVVCGGG
jgi:hypothetical protein